ncbi:hypothetical protein Ancab_023930 [Ancistrocladus abbreviatus]
MAANSADHSPAEEIAGNNDLLTEILSRLPVKPLLRFKTVSKQWHNLISDRRFSHYHSRHHPPPACSALFFRHLSTSTSTSAASLSPTLDFIPLNSIATPLPSLFNSSSMTILQSCNGLLLCKSVSDSRTTFHVCNPTINRISRLPSPSRRKSVVSLNLAFDPSKSIDLKVICVRKDRSKSPKLSYGFDIYSSEIGAWRRSIDFFRPLCDIEFRHGVYWNGSIHWLPTGRSWSKTTLFYDVENECLKNLELPCTSEAICLEGYLAESHGRLHMIQLPMSGELEFHVMELDSNDLCWFVKYRVNVDLLGPEFGCQFREMSSYSWLPMHGWYRFWNILIFGVVHGEEEEDSALLALTPDSIISVNLSTAEVTTLCDVNNCEPLGANYIYQYIPSLYRV